MKSMLKFYNTVKKKVPMRFAIPIIVSLAFLPAFVFMPDPNIKEVTINNVTVQAELADNVLERARGLSGREGLAEKQGMLFVFDEYGFFLFWMKDMLFDLDMIWIRDNKVVDISHDAKHPVEGESPATFTPREVVNYVLEVNSGFAEKYNIQIGDTVAIEE